MQLALPGGVQVGISPQLAAPGRRASITRAASVIPRAAALRSARCYPETRQESQPG